MEHAVFVRLRRSAFARLLPGLAVVVFSTFLTTPAAAVEHEEGLRLKLDEEGNNYVRLVLFGQFWGRVSELNPGSEIHQRPVDRSADFVLRRASLVAYSQIADDLLIMLHAGINAQSYRDFDAEFSVHDAYLDYRVVERPAFALHAGGGLHLWQGFSRASGGSSLTLLALDLTVLALPTVNLTDQFGRRMGVFVKGRVKERLFYRWSLDRPFNRGESVYGTPAVGSGTSFNADARSFSTGGYVEWQFLERESDVLPFRQGTYLGSRRVFNLGAGYLFHPNSMVSLDASGRRREHDSHFVGADVFLELPDVFYARGTLSTYLLYSYHDMGPNYVRYGGVANTADRGSGTSLSGGGNAEPVSGSGHHLYGVIGYLFALSHGGLQPYATTSVSWFEAYGAASPSLGAGLNYLLRGHHAKVTANYQARPIWLTTRAFDGFASEGVVQTQLYF
jgi:hypothetical protein